MSDVAERLRLRYPPPRVPRPLLVAAVAVVAAVGLAWLIWSASFHSNPPVAAQVPAFEVLSDTEVSATLTVDRQDPAQPVTCRLLAQAADRSPVGEEQVPVAGATERVVSTEVRLVTLRRAVAVTVKGCSVS